MKTKILNSLELKKEILKLGQFILRFINGKFDGEYDLESPCGISDIIGVNLLTPCQNYTEVDIKQNQIVIYMKNGEKIELVKSDKGYYNKDTIINIANKLFVNQKLMLRKQKINPISNKEEIIISEIKFDEAINRIINSFTIKNMNIVNREFIINKKQTYIEFMLPDSFLLCIYRIYVVDDKFIKHQPNIIQSYKFKKHMEVHKDDFIIPYDQVIEYAVKNGYLINISNKFLGMILELPFSVGYTALCKTDQDHDIVYAKRKNRDVFSRFTLDGKKVKTNKCILILNRNNQREDEYYVITMFPGETLIKEPEDKNIKNKFEREEIIEFWKHHAFVFNPKDVDLETVKYSYKHNLAEKIETDTICFNNI